MSWLHTAFVEEEKRRMENTVCYFCNEKGHIKSHCPDLLQEIKCYRCGKTGHMRVKCIEPQCYYCKEFGHCMKNCEKRLGK